MSDPQRLFGPARQLLLYEKKRDELVEVAVEETDCFHLCDVVVSNAMFSHHNPLEYDRMFISYLKHVPSDLQPLGEDFEDVIVK